MMLNGKTAISQVNELQGNYTSLPETPKNGVGVDEPLSTKKDLSASSRAPPPKNHPQCVFHVFDAQGVPAAVCSPAGSVCRAGRECPAKEAVWASCGDKLSGPVGSQVTLQKLLFSLSASGKGDRKGTKWMNDQAAYMEQAKLFYIGLNEIRASIILLLTFCWTQSPLP